MEEMVISCVQIISFVLGALFMFWKLLGVVEKMRDEEKKTSTEIDFSWQIRDWEKEERRLRIERKKDDDNWAENQDLPYLPPEPTGN